jgi:DNA-binding beta-propeller fold protein YncE
VNRATNSVYEIDPLTNLKRGEITVGQKPSAVAVGADSVWVTNFEDDSVTRITIPGGGQTPSRTDFDVGDGPVDVAVGDDAVWVVNRLDHSVSRLDPDTGDEVATIGIGNEPQRLTVTADRVWVTVRAPDEDGASS